MIGQVKAAGLRISELRTKVQALLPTKSLRRKTPQGEEIIILDSDDITVDIVEYRPVYLNGDVSRPGEQPYRPGMVIRQAVALAGGYDLVHFRIDNPIMQSADLRTEHETLWSEFAQQQVQVWRIEAELANKTDLRLPESEIRKLPTVTSKIIRFEAEALAANQADFEKEQTSLKRQIEQSNKQIALVTEQLEKSRQGTQLAVTGLARAQELYDKGLTPIVRVNEEQRLTLASQTQQLQATERLGQVQKDLEELQRKLQKLADQRRMDLSRRLQDGTLKLESIRHKLEAVSEKLMYAGALKSQLTRGKGATPELVIFRVTEKGQDRIEAGESTELLPGDTVEVSLRSELRVGTAARY